MNDERRRDQLAMRYLDALQAYSNDPSPGGLLTAHELGDEAVTFGLETLDLAKIHDSALAALQPALSVDVSPQEGAARADAFFNEFILPIESTHRAAVEAAAELSRLNVILATHTAELADSNRELQNHIIGRKSAEAARKTSEHASSRLLKESRQLEKHLREMTRKILAANEEKRRKVSLQLNDEISEPLLGIHVRLLALKKEAAAHQTGIVREITITQRLVEQSMKTINQFAHEFGIQREP